MTILQGLTLGRFAKELNREVNDDDIFSGAAALAYYLTLAIFPATMLVMAVLPYLPIPRVDVAILDLLHQALPAETARMFTDTVLQVTGERRGGLLSFGIAATLWATSTGMYAVMQQLNRTYGIREARGFVKARALAIGLSILFVALVIGAFSLIVLGGVIQDQLARVVGASPWLLGSFAALRWLIIVMAVLLAFAVVYYAGPDVKQDFVYITPGSVLGTLLLVLASLAFTAYVSNFGHYDATYGGIGAVIVLMLWLYITGLVLLLGSEINALIEHHAAGGKVKGEKVRGEQARDPVVAERARRADPSRSEASREADPP